MAGPQQGRSRGRGRSPRHASSSASPAAVSTVAPGSADMATSPGPPATARPVAPGQLLTRSTFRHLLRKGFGPDEAANLTALVCGIPVADVHWSLRQVNQLLFLRELARWGRFGSADGETPRPH